MVPKQIRSDDKDIIQEQSADILFANSYFVLYRSSGRLILRTTHYKYREPRHKRYLLDDLPFVAAVTIELLEKAQCGQCKIDSFLRVSTPNGEQQGDLRHYILAMRAGYPVDAIFRIRIYEGSKELVNGAHDWRISNMRCTALSDIISGMYENRAVYCDGDILYVRYGSQVFMFDQSPELSLILAAYHYHCESRDRQMVLQLGNQKTVSFSRFVIASHLYHQSMPIDSDEIYRSLQRLRTEYPGAEVDHLNAVAQDCRLQNLMLVSAAQNKWKEALQRRLVPLRTQYFADAVRYDDEHVRFTAGHFGNDGARIVEVDEILSFDEYLETLESFATEVEERCVVSEQSDELKLKVSTEKRGRKKLEICDFPNRYTQYRRDGLSKVQIAQKMGISTPTLTRLIKQSQKPDKSRRGD